MADKLTIKEFDDLVEEWHLTDDYHDPQTIHEFMGIRLVDYKMIIEEPEKYFGKKALDDYRRSED